MAKTLTCTVFVWFFLFGLSVIAGSIIYNKYFVYKNDGNALYANTPADEWLLVGGLTSTSAIFRIRLAQDGVALESGDHRLVVSVNQNLLAPVSVQAVNATSGNAISPDYGLYSVTVRDLKPRTKYFYGVQYNSGLTLNTTLEGKFSTPAKEGTPFSFSVAVGCCAWTGSKAGVFDVIRQDNEDLHMFLHLGDFHYEQIQSDSVLERLDAISTVLNSSDQAQLYRSMALNYIWDDADFLGINTPEQVLEPNSNASQSAMLAYQAAFPHYPLAASSEDADDILNGIDPDNATASQVEILNSTFGIPVYHAFTVGTVRFVVSDLQSERTNNTIYSQQQKEWIFQELQQADNYDFMVFVTSKPWIGVPTDNNRDEVFGSWMSEEYLTNRSDLSVFISEVMLGDDGPQNLLLLGGDAQMVAFDDGTNTYFGPYTNDMPYSFPILQSAPLDRPGSHYGGPYSDGCYAFASERTFQYSILSFDIPEQDGGDSAPCITIESYQWDHWGFQTQILAKKTCGKLFRQSVPAQFSNSPQCTIKWFSTSTVVLFGIEVGLLVILTFWTFIVDCRDELLKRTKKFFCSVFSIVVAAFSACSIVYTAVFTPRIAEAVPQYNLRISIVIAIAMLILMIFALLVVCCCCFKAKKPEDDAGAQIDDDPESALIKDLPDHDNSDAEWEGKETDLNDELGLNDKAKLACGQNEPSVPTSIYRPIVIRKATTSAVSEKQLPIGIVLAGGEKLHKEGLKGQGVRVAVIDTGVDDMHPGFHGQVKKRVWLRFGPESKEDDHGTSVAGTIHLLAPDAEIYDYRVFGTDGVFSEEQAIAKAIREAADDGCNVINISLGAPVPNNDIWDSVQHAYSKGAIMVCAAGNDSRSVRLTNEICFPGSYKECICVAAVSKRNGFPVAAFSNNNPLIDYAVDYAATATNVLSFKPGGGFQMMSGNSMACRTLLPALYYSTHLFLCPAN